MGVEFVADPTEEQAREIERGLGERPTNRIRAVFVESGRVVAGREGAAYWGKVHVRLLWVHPAHRLNGLGRRLMGWAEQRGRELGCVAVVVDTMSFQAPAFYARLGYRHFGRTEGYQGGASRHYFEREL